MNNNPVCIRGRRRLLQGAGALGALGGVAALPPAASAAAALPTGMTWTDLMAELDGLPTPTTRIELQIAAVADNGAAVPVTVSSALPGTKELIIVVDGNPQPVALRIAIPAGTEPWLSTRIKMARSGTVYALARTGDGLHAVARSVQVTVGGCG